LCGCEGKEEGQEEEGDAIHVSEGKGWRAVWEVEWWELEKMAVRNRSVIGGSDTKVKNQLVI